MSKVKGETVGVGKGHTKLFHFYTSGSVKRSIGPQVGLVYYAEGLYRPACASVPFPSAEKSPQPSAVAGPFSLLDSSKSLRCATSGGKIWKN